MFFYIKGWPGPNKKNSQKKTEKKIWVSTAYDDPAFLLYFVASFVTFVFLYILSLHDIYNSSVEKDTNNKTQAKGTKHKGGKKRVKRQAATTQYVGM